jgi:hypothetical protein
MVESGNCLYLLLLSTKSGQTEKRNIQRELWEDNGTES